MTIEDAVKLLRENGFRVIPPNEAEVKISALIATYISHGERWENNPAAYVEEIETYRPEYERALSMMTAEQLSDMVSTWSDDTLFDVGCYGSDLAFNREQRRKIMTAADFERHSRWLAHRAERSKSGLSLGGRPGDA